MKLSVIGAGNVIALTVGPVELVDPLNTYVQSRVSIDIYSLTPAPSFQRIMQSVLSCRVVLTYDRLLSQRSS